MTMRSFFRRTPKEDKSNNVTPASSLAGQYGTFQPPISGRDSAAPSPRVGGTGLGYQPVTGSDYDDSVTRAISGNTRNASPDTESCRSGRSGIPYSPKRLATLLFAYSIIALVAFLVVLRVHPYRPRHSPAYPPPSVSPTPSAPGSVSRSLSPTPTPAVSRRILILGDSITQGHEGDYTWRYRLWEWLRASDPSANVTFVGPFPGTYPPHDAVAPPGPRPTLPGHDIRVWGGYALDADPSFLRDSARSHFAHWGMLAAQVAPFVEDLVAEFRPDLVLSALGFNDLAYMLTVEQALRVVREIVERVQRAKPDVGFAVANVPQRLELSGREELAEKTDRYNGLLEGLLEELGTRESPVWLVRLREEYQCAPASCPAGRDGLHPNALGEFQIAKAFSQVLYRQFGLGSSNFTIPAQIPLRPCSPPKRVRAVAHVHDITVAWDGCYGAFGYFVSYRVIDGPWSDDMRTEIRQYGINLSGPGQQWEVRVKSYCGDQQDHSPWSDVISVTT